MFLKHFTKCEIKKIVGLILFKNFLKYLSKIEIFFLHFYLNFSNVQLNIVSLYNEHPFGPSVKGHS